MAVVQAVPAALEDAVDPDAPTVARLSGLLAADETQLLYSMALHGRAELGLAPDEYSGLVMVLLRMLAFRPERSGQTVAPTPRAPAAPVRATAAASPVRAAASRMTVAAEEPPPPWLDAPPEDDEPVQATVAAKPAVAVARAPLRSALGDRWTDAVEQMIQQGSIGAMVRELALQSQCMAIGQEGDTAVWRLRVERETLRAAAQRDKLQAALAQWLGQPVRLELEAGVAEDSPALRANAERERRQREAEQIIHDDPLVQALMAQYKTARIVPGSVKPH
ncbi:MAG TPA: DNA polymerase III subunit gamma/tau C-terminal domain-containing protein, partial [Albitalea sp.]|nr:DNA polymerase III subunit gamma/tau C-terminal domain-containing protein [Albitalea sp.]